MAARITQNLSPLFEPTGGSGAMGKGKGQWRPGVQRAVLGHAVGDAPFCPGGERLMRALAQVRAMAGRVSSAVVAGQAVEQAARLKWVYSVHLS